MPAMPPSVVEETLLSSGATETQLRETCDFPRSKIAFAREETGHTM